MRSRRIKRLALGALTILVLALGAKVGTRWWMLHRVTRSPHGAQRIPTITRLPRLPNLSWKYLLRDPGEGERDQLLRDILAVKLNTYPQEPLPFPRAGRHRTMGFTQFEPTEAQIAILAMHYDVFYLSGSASHRISIIKRHNPRAKVLMYFASSLTRESQLHDA
ncbi:MAG: hypothetical protein MUC88_23495, partial [Planctomycetes bacterium]|nr:hypothetical protein [Planctomycetota bacterium]